MIFNNLSHAQPPPGANSAHVDGSEKKSEYQCKNMENDA